MTGLSPGVRLPKDMNAREFARWCSEQSIESVATTAASDAVAAHVALADPHTQYATDVALTAALAALNLASGTYTPVLTNTTNITASVSYQAQYLRVGSVVTVSGRVDITPTLIAPTATALGVSLPVASNLGAIEDCAGAGSSAAESLAVTADIANDRANFQYNAAAAGSVPFYFCFQYQIL